MQKIGVIGAGAWGTALAVTSSNAGREVVILSRDADVVGNINNKHENEKYLPKISLPKEISATEDISSLSDCEALLLVVPAQALRMQCELLKKCGIPESVTLIICCKGIEQKSQKLMSEVVSEVFPGNPIAIISGPNFAAEVAKGLPAAATLACINEALGMKLVEALGSNLFRLYYSNDLIGAQIAGAVKNVLAIACGIAIGRGLGENARAALVTRGMAEIYRLCLAKGGKAETLIGLSGVGDVMLTCGSKTSRNMSFGFELGKGALASNLIGKKITEGVATAQSVAELANILNVQMPICEAVDSVIYKNAEIDSTISSLLSRPLTSEL